MDGLFEKLLAAWTQVISQVVELYLYIIFRESVVKFLDGSIVCCMSYSYTRFPRAFFSLYCVHPIQTYREQYIVFYNMFCFLCEQNDDSVQLLSLISCQMAILTEDTVFTLQDRMKREGLNNFLCFV